MTFSRTCSLAQVSKRRQWYLVCFQTLSCWRSLKIEHFSAVLLIENLSGKNSEAFSKGGPEQSDADDVLGGAGEAFKVFAQSAKRAEPGESALDDPALRQDREPIHAPLGDRQDQTPLLTHEPDRRAPIPCVAGKGLNVRMPLRRPPQDLASAHGVVPVGGMNLDLQQVAQGIHDAVPFAALHPLAAVDPAFVAGVLGLDAWRVDEGVARAGRPVLFFRRRALSLRSLG
jgi:hypothetical protein